jgi:hypothetical protein
VDEVVPGRAQEAHEDRVGRRRGLRHDPHDVRGRLGRVPDLVRRRHGRHLQLPPVFGSRAVLKANVNPNTACQAYTPDGTTSRTSTSSRRPRPRRAGPIRRPTRTW